MFLPLKFQEPNQILYHQNLFCTNFFTLSTFSSIDGMIDYAGMSRADLVNSSLPAFFLLTVSLLIAFLLRI